MVQYIMKHCENRWGLFSKDWKVLSEGATLISKDRLFHKWGAATEKAHSCQRCLWHSSFNASLLERRQIQCDSTCGDSIKGSEVPRTIVGLLAAIEQINRILNWILFYCRQPVQFIQKREACDCTFSLPIRPLLAGSAPSVSLADGNWE